MRFEAGFSHGSWAGRSPELNWQIPDLFSVGIGSLWLRSYSTVVIGQKLTRQSSSSNSRESLWKEVPRYGKRIHWVRGARYIKWRSLPMPFINQPPFFIRGWDQSSSFRNLLYRIIQRISTLSHDLSFFVDCFRKQRKVDQPMNEVIRLHPLKYERRLHKHPDTDALQILNFQYDLRRLKRSKPHERAQ